MQELLRQAASGDDKAFIDLIDRHRQTMYRVARSFLSEQMDIDDAIADTVLSCWENIGSLRSHEYFRTWLVRILINKCNDILRAGKRTTSLDTVGEELRQYAEKGFERTEFESLVKALDEQYRAIFVLYYSEGFRIREISSLLSVPQGTVGSRLRRGREQLRKYLEEGGA